MKSLKGKKEGRLLEMSPFGTGFIEDILTGARYGFHVSMIEDSVKTHSALELDGKGVQFEVAASGMITSVTPKLSSRL